MFRMITLLSVMLFLATACAPVTEQPVEPTADSISADTNPASDTGAPALKQATNTTPTIEAVDSAESQPAATPETILVAPASTVVLSDITPAPIDPNAVPQEMPAPGRPGEVRIPPELQSTVDALTAIVGADIEVASSGIKVTSLDAVTWSDGSLGCPEKGMMYTQALVDGYLIKFDVVGREVEAHTNGLEQYVICDDGVPVASGMITP